MNRNEKQKSDFLKSVSSAAKVITDEASRGETICVLSHLDADGLAAAGIIGKVLRRLDAAFRIRITQWIDQKIIEEISSEKPRMTILTDLGSGSLDVLGERLRDFQMVILDHHQTNSKDKGSFIHVNPHIYNIDGTRDISGSGVAYFTAKAIGKANVDLAPIALVGALGDMQDKFDQRELGGLNRIIVEDAVNAGLLTVEKDLIFFGRETRPIHKTLASTTSPFIPGISGEEDKSLAFLVNLKIQPKLGERWRALRDLSEDEKRKLCSALADHLLSKGLHCEVTNLIGHIYVLTGEEPWTPLRDAREFSVLLNATGRMDRPSLGVALCMGERGSSLDEANRVLEEYRRAIAKYLSWIVEEPRRMDELESIYIVHGGASVEDKMVGAISSILSLTLPNPAKPLIMYANVEEDGIAKFSARTLDTVTERGVNLGEILAAAAEKCLGKGGGHSVAAGAQVPIENIEAFVALVDQLVSKTLRREKNES